MEFWDELVDYDFSKFSIESFSEYIGRLKGCNIVFIGWAMPPGVFGAWISIKNSTNEYVFYDESAPPILEVHTKLHELGHIYYSHKTLHVDISELKQLIQTKRLADLFGKTLLRKQPDEPSNNSVSEKQAESFASVVQSKALEQGRLDSLMLSSPDDKGVHYLKQLGLSV